MTVFISVSTGRINKKSHSSLSHVVEEWDESSSLQDNLGVRVAASLEHPADSKLVYDVTKCSKEFLTGVARSSVAFWINQLDSLKHYAERIQKG